jgi:protein-S-isoprenylcysteine O-methyltransferase
MGLLEVTMVLRALLWAVVVLFPISEVMLSILKRANPSVARSEDRGSLRLLWLVIAASLGMAIGFQWVPSARLHISPTLCGALAFSFMTIGLSVRWISILTLGRLFSVDVAIHAEHTLVQTGLYRYIRHPSYTGLLLAFLGLGISFANWLSLTALVVPITGAIINRIAKEESALLQALGTSYADYCARTKRLVPGLL